MEQTPQIPIIEDKNPKQIPIVEEKNQIYNRKAVKIILF